MSITRFRNWDDFGSPYWRTPSNVIPPTSSNVDDEPTTSSRRGRTLTLTPKALISRIASRISSWSWLSGAMITLSTSCSADHGCERADVTKARVFDWLSAGLIRA